MCLRIFQHLDTMSLRNVLSSCRSLFGLRGWFLEALPQHVFISVCSHISNVSDVLSLMACSRQLHGMKYSRQLLAAWLVRRHGPDAIMHILSRQTHLDWPQRAQLVAYLLAYYPELDVNRVAGPISGMTPGLTPLVAACAIGYCDMVQLLLAVPSIDVTQHVAKSQVTALHVACDKERLSVIQLLLATPPPLTGGAHIVNIVDGAGLTPLMTSVQKGRVAVVHQLLECPHLKVNLHQKGTCRTALHLACLNRSAIGPKLVRALLSHRDICEYAVDAHQCTPRDLAQSRHNAAVLAVLPTPAWAAQ